MAVAGDGPGTLTSFSFGRRRWPLGSSRGARRPLRHSGIQVITALADLLMEAA